LLHNVGNALNSVNTSAALIAERTSSSAPEDLRTTLAAVRDSAGDLATFLQRDPRGPHLLPLLVALADQIHAEQAVLETEVRALTEGVDHIQSLIQAQQGAAGRAGVLETVDLREPIEAALGMTAPGGRPDEHIEIVREFQEVAPGPIDRHRLMEILVNLVQNARQAIQAGTPSAPRLTLRLAPLGPARARIEVEDNGVGIAPENLSRIFTHGFTTRRNGHGFGLHASANAATEMGGVLRVRSHGLGRGATFELELPIAAGAPAEVQS
jgi:signal transduction histidine kinase